MSETSVDALPTIYPSLSYRAPRAAMEWLIRAFGFRTLSAFPAGDGEIEHAELSLGTGVIMLGGATEKFGLKSPLDLPAVSQTIYVYVEDPDAHFAIARAAGADVLYEPRDTTYDSREYGVKDCEGHFWSFGTYRPAA